jgi:hypothetical protein
MPARLNAILRQPGYRAINTKDMRSRLDASRDTQELPSRLREM